MPKKPQTRADYIKERKRVDDYLKTRKAQQRAPQTAAKQKKYPLGLSVLSAFEPGYRKLYDILGQRK